MIGAIAGDIVGKPYEFHNIKTKKFDLFSKWSRPTDDSAMTLAIAQALLDTDGRVEGLSDAAVKRMLEVGRRNPRAGYGGSFRRWLSHDNPQPYGSWGNGAAMRVSGCGWAGRTLEEALALSDAVTAVTHNHPEGIKGARATTAAIFLFRTGEPVEKVRKFIVENYYNLDFTLDSIRPWYGFDESCQGTVPQALEAVFEATDYEDTIRNSISIGGDSDTIACIAGSIAEARWPVPSWICDNADYGLFRFDPMLTPVLAEFEAKFGANREKIHDKQEGDSVLRKLVEADNKEMSVVPLSPESFGNVNVDQIKAVYFTEVGLKEDSNSIRFICRDGDGISSIEGHFGIERLGKRIDGDVNFKVIEKQFPFLRSFLGISPQTTNQRNMLIDNGRWVHLSAGLGSHFFIREELFEDFCNTFYDIPSASIYEGAIPAAIEVIKRHS